MGKAGLGGSILALATALIVAVTAPAAAEFFGCNDKGKGRVLATYTTGAAPAQGHASRKGYTHEFAAQSTRPRITVYPRSTSPGPNAKRYCRSWLAKEYRISGTVIVPRMQCWWQ
jgi:hypothetical protein